MQTDKRELVGDLEMARELIQEAKGADGPNGGFVTDHLDAAENWIIRVQEALNEPLLPGREAQRDDIRRNIIRQLGDDPNADRIILPGTDWDIVLEALAALIPAQPRTEQGEAEGRVSPEDAFEMGYFFASSLQGQTLEDSRAVGRLLMADSFEPIHERINAIIARDGFNSFESADLGICSVKRIILEALANGGERIPIHGGGDAGRVPHAAKTPREQFLVEYGPRCRDCADESGVCPSTGIGCGERQQAVRWMLSAIEYGEQKGFIAAPPGRINADEINLLLTEEGVERSAYLAVKIAEHLESLSTPDHDCRDQVGAILDDAGQETGYHRTENGEIVTLGDEYDDECAGCDTGCPSCAHLPHRPRGG